MKRKNEEMKTKIYSLRTQKMELDRRILEKQSSIDSLKDEQRAIESALEEKQNEIKLLREKEIDPGRENLQVIALMESLKKKEAEIEDLKHRTEDPPSPPVNLTVNSQVSKGAEEGEQLHESAGYRGGENLTSEDRSKIELNNSREAGATTARVEDGTENKAGDSDRREMIGEHRQMPQESHDEVINNGDSQEHDSRDLREIQKGGVKLEETDNSGGIGIGSRVRGKHGHAGKTKGKRWRMLVKNRWSENNANSVNNEAVSKRSRQIFLDDEDGLKSRTSDTGKLKREGVNNPMEVRKAVNFSDAKLQDPHDVEDSKDLKNMVVTVNADTTHQVVLGREILLENLHAGVNEEVQVLKIGSGNGTSSNITMDVRKQKLDEGSDIQQQSISSNINNVEHDAEEAGVLDDTNEVSEDLKVANGEDDDHFFRESSSDVEEEEYKEETDESEF
jgi:hypothetical protein